MGYSADWIPQKERCEDGAIEMIQQESFEKTENFLKIGHNTHNLVVKQFQMT